MDKPHASRPDLTSYARDLAPILAILFVGAIELSGYHVSGVSALALTMFSIGFLLLLVTVFSAVHYAETIAHWAGEPYGTLILTIAVTTIEAALILSLISGDHGSPTLARDTVEAVIMLVTNGVIGLCLLVGGLHYREQTFSEQGANAYLSVLIVLAVITLILPNTTVAAPGPEYSRAQLAFIAAVSIALYGVFLFIQTVHHRDYFIGETGAGLESAGHAASPTRFEVARTAGLLVLSLLGAILLAETITKVIADGLEALHAPVSIIGIILATLVLLPEIGFSIKAARRNDLQRSINTALGSVLATIGLTIPVTAAVMLFLHKPMPLGLDPQKTVLLLLTFAVAFLSFGTGRTNILMGFVHLVVLAVYLLVSVLP